MIHEQNIHMIGIGGIGMSALAQFLQREGKHVSGSDREDSRVTTMLREKGIEVAMGHAPLNVPEDAELVIYSDAVPADNPERVRAREYSIPESSYFEALGMISEGKFTIAVSGTHGKTTTAGMLAKILYDANVSPTAIIGSIVKDFKSNFLPGSGEVFVVEACEYRDHVLKLAPNILVITNIEWDHTDFFRNLDALQETFRKAIANLPSDGVLVTNPSDPSIAGLVGSSLSRVVDYTKIQVPDISLIGEFNKMNARAAKAAARAYDKNIAESTIDKSLSDFKGSWRRFEYKGKTKNGALVYDDYAHHPTEIQSTILGIQERFPDKKLLIAFHPHLYSRTRDLMEEFSKAFHGAEKVFVAPVFAAREEVDHDSSHVVLAEKIQKEGVSAQAVDSFDEIKKQLEESAGENSLIVTMGAGDIYKVADDVVCA